jgi:hypothetical protein
MSAANGNMEPIAWVLATQLSEHEFKHVLAPVEVKLYIHDSVVGLHSLKEVVFMFKSYHPRGTLGKHCISLVYQPGWWVFSFSTRLKLQFSNLLLGGGDCVLLRTVRFVRRLRVAVVWQRRRQIFIQEIPDTPISRFPFLLLHTLIEATKYAEKRLLGRSPIDFDCLLFPN